MPIVVLEASNPTIQDHGRPVACPNCGSEIVHRWGQISRNIQDTTPINAIIFRYLCEGCNKTFRYYPNGMDRSSMSIRIRRLAALLWLLDLSLRDVVEIFEKCGVSLNRMTVWREGQSLIDMLQNHNAFSFEKKYSFIRKVNNESLPRGCVELAVDLADCPPQVVGILDTMNPLDVIEWLQPVVKDLNIRVLLLGTSEFIQSEPIR